MFADGLLLPSIKCVLADKDEGPCLPEASRLAERQITLNAQIKCNQWALGGMHLLFLGAKERLQTVSNIEAGVLKSKKLRMEVEGGWA